MISEYDMNCYQLQLYDQRILMISQIQFENLNEIESSARSSRMSSQCLIQKKKIRRKQKRPSFLRIDETVRDVQIYSLDSCKTNLENINEVQKQIHV